jgi:hypothetical protein
LNSVKSKRITIERIISKGHQTQHQAGMLKKRMNG